MSDQKIVLNTPKDINQFKGQYILFYSEEKNPKVIFNSFFAEEAYDKAKKIGLKSKKFPVVYRVDEEQNLITHFISNIT